MEWYIDVDRQIVDLSTVRSPQGFATKDVWRLVQRDDGSLLTTRWTRTGAPLRPYDVQQAQYRASSDPVPTDRVPPPAPAPSPSGASSAATADLVKLLRLEQNGAASLRRAAAALVAEVTDAAQVVEDWADLTGVAANGVQVAGNRLYANNTQTNPVVAYVPLPRNIAPGEKFHVATTFEYAAQSGGSFMYFGLSTRAFDNMAGFSAAYNDDFAAGLSGSNTNSVVSYRGANVAGITPPANAAALGTLTAGRYHMTIDGDETTISLMIRRADDASKSAGWSFPVTALAGKTIGQVACIIGDTRGTGGHSIGPVIANVGTQQPGAVKTVAGVKVDGAVVRDVLRNGPSGDKWRIGLPANYDPRKPAPVAIYFHPSASTVAPEHRPWSNANDRALTTALHDAGYIVASAADGAVSNNLATDRYANDASLANHLDLYRYLTSHFAVSQVVFYGSSMGAQVALNLLARRTIPNVAAGYFMSPGVEWKGEDFIGSIYDPHLRAQYGVTTDAEVIEAMKSRNSMAREGWEFRGVPIRMVSAAGDTVTPGEQHVTPFLAKIEPYATEASRLDVAGAHVGPATYNAADLMAFLGRHVA